MLLEEEGVAAAAVVVAAAVVEVVPQMRFAGFGVGIEMPHPPTS